MKYNFKKILFLNFFVLGFFACPVSVCGVFGVEEARAATYYVATTGNDTTGNGSQGTPWATLDYALRSGGINHGDTIEFTTGTYSSFNGVHQNIVPLIGGSTSSGDVTVKATNGATVIFNLPNNIATAWLLPQTNQNILFEGIQFTNGNIYNSNLVRLFYTSSIKFKDCIIDNNNQTSGSTVFTSANDIISTIEFENTVIRNSKGYTSLQLSSGGSSVITVRFINSRTYETKRVVYANGTASVRVYARDSIFGASSEAPIEFYNNLSLPEVDFENCIFTVGGQDLLGSDYKDNAVLIADTPSAHLINNSEKFNFKNNKLWTFDVLGVDLYKMLSSSYFLPYDESNVFSDPGFTLEQMRLGDFSTADFVRPEDPLLINGKVSFFGDSIMRGYIPSPGGMAAYQQFNIDTGLVVANNTSSAISGLHIHGARHFVDYTILTEKPEKMFVAIGLNNVNQGYPLNGMSEADTSNAIIEILERIEGWGVEPIWLGIESKSGLVPDNTLTEAINARVESSCVDHSWNCGSVLSQMRLDENWLDIYYTDRNIDSTHPNEAGHKLISRLAEYLYYTRYTIETDKIDISAGARIYADGKFRNLGTANSNTADLSITPVGGVDSFNNNDKSYWLDITKPDNEDNILWTANQKKWKESSDTLGNTSTLHTIGDLEANKYYNVSVDNILGENIEGENCISGICKSNSEGKIAFTYTGTYSEHTFKVEAGDNTPPAVTSGTTLKFPTDTKEVTLSITTNENSTCKYSANESDGYDTMTAFETTGEKTHSTLYQAVQGAAIYDVHAICRDVVGNNTSHTLTFEIAKAKEDSKVSGIKSDNLTLDKNKKIYLEEDRTKLKGEDQTLANGKVKIYKNNKLYKEIIVDENGKWSKKISFDHDRNYDIKLEFFDEFGTLRDEKEYEIKVDTEKPVFQNKEESSSVTKDERISFPAEDEETKIDYYKIKVLDKNGRIIRKWKKQKEDFYEIPKKIKDEAKTVIVRAYDRAGNKSELRFEIGPRKASPRGGAQAQSSVSGNTKEMQEVIETDIDTTQQESPPEPTTGNNSPATKTEIQSTASEVPAKNSPADKSKWWNPFSWF